MLALHRQPDQWEKLTRDPSLAANSVEELLRYDSSVQLTARKAAEDVEIGDEKVPLKRGEGVICLLGAGNRDPARYDDPERLLDRFAEYEPPDVARWIDYART